MAILDADLNFEIFAILAISGKFCSISAVSGPILMIFSVFLILTNIIDMLQHFPSTYTHFSVPKMQKLLNQPPHPTPSSSPSPSPTSSSPFPALVSTQLPDTSRPPPQRRGYVTEGTYKKNPFAWSKVAGQKHRRFVPQPQQIPLQNQYQALADY